MPDTDPPHDIDAVVTVTLYADGYSTVSVQPGPHRRDAFDHPDVEIERAAARLASIRAVQRQERYPVECPRCGTLVEGILTDPDGTHVVRPCGHDFE